MNYRKCRQKSGKKNYGGIVVYVNKKNQEGVSYIPNDNDNVIWCKLRKGFFNTQKDIFVGTAYLIPESLERQTSPNYLIEKLEEDLLYFSNKGTVVLQGDLNARTGNLSDFIEQDDDTYFCLPDDYKFDQTKRRYSEDPVLSARGRTLIDTCIQHDLRILNGRIWGDRDGKNTCHQPNGSSVVCYALADESLLDRFQYLKVEPLKPHLSDHCSLSYSLSLDFEHIREHPHPLKPAPIQYTWRKGDEIKVK